eukprot:CAMPEP_0113729512 /NCGR_PEP_ID=MMETSP0038_2-20120614/42603_1 /TAXON_ID=2898 /ORGANISM="Cryptomonas paramecium" /LENGTH=120 /DNA_ID=CAMNT_0000661387 /DNA_START=191 /DNA_END=553 /DNA_ORIENTATION=- /assembly_acc=CAM_ASM_000170
MKARADQSWPTVAPRSRSALTTSVRPAANSLSPKVQYWTAILQADAAIHCSNALSSLLPRKAPHPQCPVATVSGRPLTAPRKSLASSKCWTLNPARAFSSSRSIVAWWSWCFSTPWPQPL